MKISSICRNAAVLLLFTTLCACKKEKLKFSGDVDKLAGPPPPAICTNPIVSVSDFAGNGGTGSENGKLHVAGIHWPTAVAQSISGTVQYVSTGSTIRRISSVSVTNLVTLPEAIHCLATDSEGNIYAGGETTISKVSTAGTVLATWGRLSEPGVSNTPIARFSGVIGLAIDPEGNIYVAEWRNRIIRKIQVDGTIIFFAGLRAGFYYDVPLANGPALEAKFSYIGGIALNASGTRLYVADEFSIRLIEDGYVYAIAGGSVRNLHRYVLDGNGTSARFSQLEGITIDAAENLYVTDRTTVHPSVGPSSSYVRKVIKMTTGIYPWKVSTLAGGTNGHVNGVGNAAKFNDPKGLVINATATTAFVADFGNNRVRKLTLSCAPVY